MDVVKNFFNRFRNRPLKDGINLYGIMTVSVYDVKRGKKERVLRLTKKNQITDKGREVVLELLAQTTSIPVPPGPFGTDTQQHPEYNNLWSLSIGTSGVPPTLGDTGLGAVVWTDKFIIPAERQVNLGGFEINISKEVPAGQATGSTIREAGLFTRGDDDDPAIAVYRRMYARQIHPGVLKSDLMSVVYDWRLGVTIQV
jgi:hypothetical protein